MVEKKPEASVEQEINIGEDPVNNPGHYTQARVECIEVIEDLGLGYHLATAMKYLWRANFKGDRKEDLEKAKWFIERELQRTEDDG